ncbi:MAG: DUF1622 domain-containing protein [Desulfobacterales bacterium]
MIQLTTSIAEMSAATLEVIGVSVITLIAFYSLINGVIQLLRKVEFEVLVNNARQSLGRGILLGLELLVAADIVHTIAVEFSYKSMGILAIIVGIRTFLSFTLEIELSGRLPWRINQ